MNLELYKNVSKLIFKTYAVLHSRPSVGGDVTRNEHADQPAQTRLCMTLEISAVCKDADQSAWIYVCFACGLKLSKQDAFSSRARQKFEKKYTKLIVA